MRTIPNPFRRAERKKREGWTRDADRLLAVQVAQGYPPAVQLAVLLAAARDEAKK